MGLLNAFSRFFHDVQVYTLTSASGTWGTSEKETYTLSKTISAYIQPLGGSETLKNQSLDKVTTHKMYIKADVSINDTDRIIYNSRSYHITFNQDNGISNILDHKEIGLVLQR